MKKIILLMIMFCLAFAFTKNVLGETCFITDGVTNLSVYPCKAYSNNGEYTYNFKICSKYSKSLDITTNNIFNVDSSSKLIEKTTNCINSTYANSSKFNNCSTSNLLLSSISSKQKINTYSDTGINPFACKDYIYSFYPNANKGKFDINIMSYDKGYLASNYTLDPFFENITTANPKTQWCNNQFPCKSQFGNWTYEKNSGSWTNLVWQEATTAYRTSGSTNPSIMNYSSAFPFSDANAIGVTNNGGGIGDYIASAFLVNDTLFDANISMSQNQATWISEIFLNSTGNLLCSFTGAGSCSVSRNLSIGSKVYFSVRGKTDSSFAYVIANINSDVGSNDATFTFDNQIPSDIKLSDIFSTRINVSYNLTYSGSLNSFSINVNETNLGNQVPYFINGTRIFETAKINYLRNISNNYLFTFMLDNLVSGIYNLNNLYFNSTHLNQSLSTSSDYAKISFLNISGNKYQTIFEIMLLNSGGTPNPQPLYFCNSSYTTGSVVLNPNCVLFNTITETQFNHCHFNNLSCHYISIIPINNSKVGNVFVTNESYIVLTGGNNRGFFYINNISRANAVQTSNNNGNTYTNFVGTIDAHIHQNEKNDSINYQVCANITSGVYCSAQRSDIIDISSYAPTSPFVYSPNSSNSYNNTNILIKYLSSFSATNTIIYYSIDLLKSDLSFDRTIIANNSNNLNYTYNSSLITNGNYYIKVSAVDNESLSNFGISELFTINNEQPQTPTTSADAILKVGNNLMFGFLIALSAIVYFLSLLNIGDSQTGSIFLKFASVLLALMSTIFVDNNTMILICAIVYIFMLALIFAIELILKAISGVSK